MEIKQGQTQRQHLDDLNKDLKRKIQAKEHEIDQVKSHYQDKLEDTKVTSAEKINKYHESLSDQKLEAYNNKQEQIKNYQAQLEQTKKELEQEKEILKEYHRQNLAAIDEHSNFKLDRKIEDARKETHDISNKAKQEIDKLKFQTEQQKNQENHKAQNELNNLISRNEKAIQELQQDYQQKKKVQERELENQLNKEQKDFEKQLKHLQRKSQIKTGSASENYKQELEKKKDHYQERMVEREEHFESRYQQLKQEHQKVLTNIMNRFEEQINDIVETHASKKESMNSRINDDFYQIRTLEPHIQDNTDHYIISLEIPEYEKEHVNLNAHGRKVNLSLTRSFNEELRNEEQGRVDKSKRSEVFVKEFQTEDIMDPSQITQSYQEGRIYFKIGKA